MKADCFASFLLVSLAACGTEDPSGPMTSVPQLVSSVPANNATGVRSDSSIMLTFSEPMDTASVEAAIDASEVGGGTFSWDDAATTLTIVPAQPLAYAEGVGDDPATVTAKVYGISVSRGAESQQGVPVDQPWVIQFSTLKRMTTTAENDDLLTLHVNSSGTLGLAGSDLRVGDQLNTNTYNRALVTFDLSTLPSTAVDIESAMMVARVLSVAGDPFAISPQVTSYHVSFADLASGFDATPLASTGMFANAETDSIAHPVTAQVDDDLAHRAERANRSQFRLQFDDGTDNDGGQDYVQFSRASLELSLTYLAP